MHHQSVLATAAAIAALGLTAAGISTASAAPSDGDVTSTRQLSTKGAVAQAAIAAARETKAARVGARQELTATQALEDSNDATHVRLERTYRGLRVVGGDSVIHRSSTGKVTSVTQTLDEVLALSITPKVSAAKVTGLIGTTAKKAGAPELVVDAIGAEPRLAWLVTKTGTQPDGTPSKVDTYIDATTGKTLHEVQRIQTVDGSGQSLYGGTVPLNLTKSGSSFQMRDASRGGTYTVDLNNKTDSPLCSVFGFGCAKGTVFSGPDTSFGNGSTSSRESAGVDAQYGTDATWDYYQLVHGRSGIFGTGAGSYNRVHYGQNYVNAFWDGEKMTYGDGDGNRFGPLTSLDVAGHEMSHGVTENSANLTYSGESGGLNEATSDIFGTMVEFYANNSDDARRLPDRRGVRRVRQGPAPHGRSRFRRQVRQLLLQRCRQRGRPLLLGHRQPLLLPAGRGIGRQDHQRRRAQLPHLQRVVGCRHRSGRGPEDLVPRPHGVHDVEHQLRRRTHRDPQRRTRPVRQRQRPVQRRRRGVERRQRRLIRRSHPSIRTWPHPAATQRER